MSQVFWPLVEHHRALLAKERGAARKDPGGRLSVALIYSNTYQVGMANLGLATVYRIINQQPDALCQRFFLPDSASLPLYAKAVLELFLDRLLECGGLSRRKNLLRLGQSVAGFYAPCFYEPSYHADGTLASLARPWPTFPHA